ncbi:hypothetical protein [Shewanella khirikhana]|uniref:DUF4143 domain-containing protein n=1 Tax=Shewanella khirikhana TaxID=1965282 RepID=A0ABM7DXB2_9GAMM|nr:hypothetical protein [Shewanella khirikhana]AZQ13190.1 hypothetical protein STH12_04164 [Shewanella khirikhana]
MDKWSFLATVLEDDGRISEAIATGAAWEIWMQVELMIACRRLGWSVARELPYPAPLERKRLDMMFSDGREKVALELKVESAQTSGDALMAKVEDDSHKLALYPQSPGLSRWLLVLGYSWPVRCAMEDLERQQPERVILRIRGGIAAMLWEI